MKKLPKKIITQRIAEFQAMQRRRVGGGMPAGGATAVGGAAGGLDAAAEPAADTVLETALFLEDVFGIEIDDTEMTAGQLGPSANLTAFVVRKMGES